MSGPCDCADQGCQCVMEDGECIAFAGAGVASSPYVASPIIPATVTHPLLTTEICNGLACTADGMEVQPDRQWGPTVCAAGATPPDIVADTAAGPHVSGLIDWGAAVDCKGENFDACRTAYLTRVIQIPTITATLEVGASFSFGHSVNFPTFDFLTRTFINNGNSTETWVFPFYTLGPDLTDVVAAGLGMFGPVDTFQLTVSASGFGGGSTVSAGDAILIAYYAWPL